MSWSLLSARSYGRYKPCTPPPGSTQLLGYTTQCLLTLDTSHSSPQSLVLVLCTGRYDLACPAGQDNGQHRTCHLANTTGINSANLGTRQVVWVPFDHAAATCNSEDAWYYSECVQRRIRAVYKYNVSGAGMIL